MSGRSIVRIERNDSDMRFREKVNSNFQSLAVRGGFDGTTIQLIASNELIAELFSRVPQDDFDDLVDGTTPFTGPITGPRVKLTPEGGIAVLLLNRTGAASVKGTLVSASTSYDDSFIKQTNEYDTIGVVYESGIADTGWCWVVVSGRCQVLMKDGVAATRGNIVIAADTDGRADSIANPGSGLPATETHFKECGHFIQSVSAGTDVLAYVIVHFN